MTEDKEGMRRFLKEQGLTDEDIEKKLCISVYDKSGSSTLFGKKDIE